jgi:hypothetical protein
VGGGIAIPLLQNIVIEILNRLSNEVAQFTGDIRMIGNGLFRHRERNAESRRFLSCLLSQNPKNSFHDLKQAKQPVVGAAGILELTT